MRTSPLAEGWAIVLLSLTGGVWACSQTATAPATGLAQSPSAAPTTQPPLDPEVDRILTRLEQRQVRDLHARVTWKQRYLVDLEEDAVTKSGEIWYQRVEPVAKFLIHFTARVSAGRKDALDERHLFDGQWYTELQARTKTVNRHQIRRADDPGDPYKVGEGVFPLPFGQKKEDILREFDVLRVPGGPEDPTATDHVRLVPRAETKTGQTYRQLDFWISQEGRTDGLPIKVQVAKKDGTGKVNSYITITFDDVRLNRGFSSSVFELKIPPGYEVNEERLTDAAPPAGGQVPPSDDQIGMKAPWLAGKTACRDLGQ